MEDRHPRGLKEKMSQPVTGRARKGFLMYGEVAQVGWRFIVHGDWAYLVFAIPRKRARA